MNPSSPVTIVVPFTTYRDGARIYPSQCVVDPLSDNGLTVRSVALGEQLRVVDRLRFAGARFGLLAAAQLGELDNRLAIALALPWPRRLT